MVPREVGEDDDVEQHALDASLMERMRRNLHRHAGDAGVDERAEYTLQLHGAGGREATAALDGVASAADEDSESSDRRASPFGRVEDVAEHVDGSGLPVRPRDADELQLTRGPTVRRCGRKRRGAPAIANDERRHARGNAVRLLGHRGYGASTLRHFEKVVAVALRPANGDEE